MNSTENCLTYDAYARYTVPVHSLEAIAEPSYTAATIRACTKHTKAAGVVMTGHASSTPWSVADASDAIKLLASPNTPMPELLFPSIPGALALMPNTPLPAAPPSPETPSPVAVAIPKTPGSFGLPEFLLPALFAPFSLFRYSWAYFFHGRGAIERGEILIAMRSKLELTPGLLPTDATPCQ